MSACHTEIPSLGLCGQVFTATEEIAVVEQQELVGPATYRIRLRCPKVARQIEPGQFFMVRMPQRSDPLLGRPFALLDVVRDEAGAITGLDFGYVVVGKMTGVLAELAPGSEVALWGPLGNGFSPPTADHIAIVAGGIGQTPFVAFLKAILGLESYGTSAKFIGRQPPRKISFCYGARNAAALTGVDWFQLPGVELHLTTDDGSRGQQGFVTSALQTLLNSDDPPGEVYCCGPEPMMRAVAQKLTAADVPGWLSLETPMACGFGACFSCVVRVRQPDGSWDYRRSCVEGPVFPAADIVFAEDA